ncbi:MAG: exo-alpha-sialidase [Phycisphaerales bacterium]|nr:MAG: exo-alpha-sialidase [Phycisphaerales bacterium]
MSGRIVAVLGASVMCVSWAVLSLAEAHSVRQTDERTSGGRISANAEVSQMPPPHREAPVDPPALKAAPRHTGVVARSEPIVRGRFQSIQVNVDSFGNNIVGDAANEPSIAIDPTDPDKMVIGWRQFDTISSNFRTSGYGYSHDGGQTWTFPGVLEPGVFSSDPVLASDLNGNIYYYALQSNRGPGSWPCYLYRTSDGGVTWPQEVYAFGGDKAWIAVDSTTGIGSGNIYMAWSPWYGCCDGHFSRSTDGGLTFLDPISIPRSVFFGTITVGLDGAVYVSGGVNYPYGPFAVARSSNAQDPLLTPSFDFATEVNLDGFLALSVGPNPEGLLGQVWVASDHSDGPTQGNLYLLCSVERFSISDPLDVMFARSTDGGLTWSAPIRVNDDPVGNNAWQWFGTMSVAPNGRIDAIWNDTRNSGADNLSELYYSFSLDGGLSWATSVPVSPMFDSHVGWPRQNKLGDYYDMISDNGGTSVAYAATFNGEQDVYFLRIPFDCNDNGIADTIDIAEGTSTDCNENLTPDECEPDEDCNANGVQDICDIAGVTSEDCNLNGVPDSCDIAAGTSPDINGDGVPDECECTGVESPVAAPNSMASNRYMAFVAGNPGRQTALRVTLTDLPAPFEAFEGQKMWVGSPQEVSENAGKVDPSEAPGFPTFMIAKLQCDADFRDWNALGTVYLYGAAVVPDGVYDIQAIEIGCTLALDGNYSAGLQLTTSLWGDLVRNCITTPCGPPDGVVNITDITAVVDKFKNLDGAPIKSRCDLEPNQPDLLINVSDASEALDAFRGFGYPLDGPGGCR